MKWLIIVVATAVVLLLAVYPQLRPHFAEVCDQVAAVLPGLEGLTVDLLAE